MFKVNEYFGGKVKSIAFETSQCPATVGVIAPGEYEFGTATVEIMTVITGKLAALLPDTQNGPTSAPANHSPSPPIKNSR